MHSVRSTILDMLDSRRLSCAKSGWNINCMSMLAYCTKPKLKRKRNNSGIDYNKITN